MRQNTIFFVQIIVVVQAIECDDVHTRIILNDSTVWMKYSDGCCRIRNGYHDVMQRRYHTNGFIESQIDASEKNRRLV